MNKTVEFEQEALSEVQLILTELYEAYRTQVGRRRISDNQFAKFLGVSPSNWNYWINGTRLPELVNALRLAPTIERLLGPDARLHFMQVLGYPNYMHIEDSVLQVIIAAWPDLPRALKDKIHHDIVENQKERTRSSLGEQRFQPKSDADFDR